MLAICLDSLQNLNPGDFSPFPGYGFFASCFLGEVSCVSLRSVYDMFNMK